MKKNKDPKDKKPEVGGAPTPPIQPKPVNDSKPSFSYSQLIFEDYFHIDNRRFVRFFCDIENPVYVDIPYGMFIEYQLNIWEQTNKILEDSKEGDKVCTCNMAYPDGEEVDTMTIRLKIFDDNSKQPIETEENIPIFLVYDLSNLKVGNICKFDDTTKKL